MNYSISCRPTNDLSLRQSDQVYSFFCPGHMRYYICTLFFNIISHLTNYPVLPLVNFSMLIGQLLFCSYGDNPKAGMLLVARHNQYLITIECINFVCIFASV